MSKEKEKLKFVFPNVLAKFMKKVEMRTQMESSLLSMSLIMCGMTLMAIYLIFFGQMGWVYKGLILLNLTAAFIFISSFLVTTYQQYISYMEMAGIDPTKHREEILKRGNIFKRIKLALKNRKDRKKLEETPKLELVNDAIDNMVKIKQEELKEYKKLEIKADELRNENIKQNQKGGET